MMYDDDYFCLFSRHVVVLSCRIQYILPFLLLGSLICSIVAALLELVS